MPSTPMAPVDESDANDAADDDDIDFDSDDEDNGNASSPSDDEMSS